MNTARFLAGALAALLLITPAQAQMTPDEVEGLMTEAFEAMTEAAQLIKSDREKAIARYDEACDLYVQAQSGLESLGLPAEQTQSIEQIIHYNTACARSLQGRANLAMTALRQAFDTGWNDLEHMEKDTDLDPIRESADYKALIASKAGELEQEAQDDARAELAGGAKFPYALPPQKSFDGEKLSLDALRGKVVIVNYWGSWCGPCKVEIPHLVELKKQFGDRLEIVGLAWEHGEAGDATVAKVKATAKSLGVTYPLSLIMNPELLREVPEFQAFPTTLFIDKSGRVRAKLVGARPMRELKAMVAVLDDEAAVAPAPKATKKAGGDEWFK